MIQEMCKTAKDYRANGQELEMFWSMMDFWRSLDERLVDAMAFIWNDIVSIAENPARRPFLEKIVSLFGASNGITNCTQRFICSIVKMAVKKKQPKESSSISQENGRRNQRSLVPMISGSPSDLRLPQVFECHGI